MPRFVILRHEVPPGSPGRLHWDLMLESGGLLRTWALQQEPQAGATVAAKALPDHRSRYLDYEGPLSNDRGWVTRWDAGSYTLQRDSPDALVLTLAGRRIQGTVTLTRCPTGQRWRVRFSRD